MHPTTPACASRHLGFQESKRSDSRLNHKKNDRLNASSDKAPTLTVRGIRNDDEMEAVYRLTHDAYRDAAYCDARPDGRLVHYPGLETQMNTTVFVVLIEGRIVASQSLTIDGPAGLPTDLDFPGFCDDLRKAGKKLGTAWRIVTDRHFRDQRRVVMNVLHQTVWGGVDAGLDICFASFHPKHERIYHRLLNMRTVARKDATHGLNNAPAVLLQWDRDRCPTRYLMPPICSADYQRACELLKQ